MKKLLVVVLAMAMTLALATCATAVGSVYIDRIWEGTENESGAHWNGSFIGGGALFDKFKIGAEYGLGTMQGGVDMSLYNVKFGYRVIDNNGTQLDIVAVYLNLLGDMGGTEILNATSTLIGLDFTQYFSKNFLISLQYDYSLSGAIEAGGTPLTGDKTFTVLRFKTTYFFTEGFGASLGYQSLVLDSDVGFKRDFTATSLGVVFRFM